MSYLSDYCTRIRAWIDDEDISDATVTEWIRDAEERLNNELRTDEQIQREYATFDDDCALLPADWLETIYVRLKGGKPFHYISNDSYWGLDAAPPITTNSGEVDPRRRQKNHYTHIGKTLFVWPKIDPDALTQIEVAYFRKIIPLGDVKDTVFDRYPSLYRHCTLTAATPYLVEDERLVTWTGLATAGIQAANNAAKKARFSGSPLAPMIRGFG